MTKIDVIVRMDGDHGAERLAQNLVGAVCDNLIGVHVGLCAGAGLPDDKGEMVGEFSGCDLTRGPEDCPAALFIKDTKVDIGERRCLFLQAKGFDDGWRHFFGPYGEIPQTTLCLGAPVAVGGHGNPAHGIML